MKDALKTNKYYLHCVVGLFFLLTNFTSCSKTHTIKKQEMMITFLVGNAVVKSHDKVMKTARVGMLLKQKDIIVTKDVDSVCDIKTETGSVVRLNGKTTLQLEKLLKDKRVGGEKTTLGLISGKVLVKARKLIGKEKFDIKTPTAVTGVRGTQFLVSYFPGKETKIAVRKGRVSVKVNMKLTLPAKLKKYQNKINQLIMDKTEVFIVDGQSTAITKAKYSALKSSINKNIEKDSSGILDRNKQIKFSTKFNAIVKKNLIKNKTVVMPVSEKDKEFQEDFNNLSQLSTKIISSGKGQLILVLNTPETAVVSFGAIKGFTIKKGSILRRLIMAGSPLKINVSKKGYKTFTRTVTIKNNQILRIVCDLKKDTRRKTLLMKKSGLQKKKYSRDKGDFAE